MRIGQNKRASRAIGMVLLMAVALMVACGNDSSGNNDAAAASATAERRDQAIATFTAEAAAVAPTATRFPTSSAGTSSTPTPVRSLTPASTPTPNEAELADRTALEELLRVRSETLGSGDFDAWYETCAPYLRESAQSSKAIEKQLASLRLEPEEVAGVEFVLEQIFLTAGTSATIVWGWRSGPDYFPGVGGGPYTKEDGQWYSIGWGCV